MAKHVAHEDYNSIAGIITGNETIADAFTESRQHVLTTNEDMSEAMQARLVQRRHESLLSYPEIDRIRVALRRERRLRMMADMRGIMEQVLAEPAVGQSEAVAELAAVSAIAAGVAALQTMSMRAEAVMPEPVAV